MQGLTERIMKGCEGVKAKNKDNILVDLYNTKLTENPETDKDTILEFFHKADSHIAKDVLGRFQWLVGSSWFETEDVKDFYNLWKLVKELVESHVNKQPITLSQYEDVKSLLENTKPTLMIKDKATGKYLENLPDNFEPGKYEFVQGTTFEQAKTTVNQEHLETIITFGRLKYKIFVAIQQLLNGEIVIRKCLAEDCQRAFIPHTLKQVFHSNICRARIAKRRERNKKSYVTVN